MSWIPSRARFMVGIVVASIGCSSTTEHDAAVAEAEIVNGVTTDDFPAVGRIWFGNDEQGWGDSCTATLIRPRVILTAAHCVTGKPNSGVRAKFGGRTYYVDSWVWSGSYVKRGQLDRSFDLSIARLTEPVEGIEPMPLVWDLPPDNTWFTAIGFGYESAGGRTGTKRRAPAWITRRAATWVQARGWSEHADWASVCFGDSGGPAIDEHGKVFGVLAQMESDRCDGWFAYTRVVADRQMIESTLADWEM